MKKLNTQHWFLPLLLICVLIVGGCASNPPSAETLNNNPAGDQTVTPISQNPTQPMTNLPQLNGKATVVMTVNGSPITIEVDGTNAPVTAGNFVDLVNKGVYDGLAFHRVVREPDPFVVQGGDPQSKDPKFPSARLGTGGFIDPATSKERMIPLEIKPKGAEQPIYSKTLESARITTQPVLSHRRGAVAMARSQFPDSASSQFYFSLAELPFLDGSYAVFGNVTDGMNVVDQIKQGDRIDSAKVTQGLENLKN
ncbi:MAG: peptidylprolyl isomerase [Oscillatoriales cyanobacterium CG2_30_40_61]|nr:MAG: peptidylprolyl isomerase [Oscillatoriales cyanobacterium CG2_30_40_61]